MTESYGVTVASIALSWVLSVLIFAALIIYISKHPQKRSVPLKIAFVIMFLGGMAFYCACYYRGLERFAEGQSQDKYLSWVRSDNAKAYYIPYVIMRSIADVGMMFYGRANSDVFYDMPESRNPLAVCLFWLIHLMAFYTTASALLIRFGNDLLRWIRIMTSNVSDVALIFGVNADSLALGRNIAGKKGCLLVYVDSVVAEDYEASIRDLGGLSYSDKDALNATASFLDDIHVRPHKTKFRLYALSGEYDRNMHYARMMLASLEKAGILPEQTELVLLGTEEWKGIMFQSSGEKYGYGSVVSFDECEMSARLLMHEYPLCNAINFDANGRASEDMNVLIVGFGRIGHEVLRKVIANGQFEGSSFHVTVYDPNFEQRAGFFKTQYPNMFANYNIDFEPHGGRGIQIFQFLRENASTLKYIVVCLDDRDTARDIAVHMSDRLHRMGYSLNVYTCDSKSVRCYSQYAQECATHWLYDSELLYSGELDQYAMELNHRYCGGKSLNEDWKNCGYFDRMSSRASVDYLMPFIRRMTAMNGGVLTAEQRENISRSEHLRWCAFHYTFGYDVMDKEEFAGRIKERLNEIREHGRSKIKPTKDTKKLTHVCLVDWDELDEISRIENSLTQSNKSYKDFDRMNVDMVTEIMRDGGEVYYEI